MGRTRQHHSLTPERLQEPEAYCDSCGAILDYDSLVLRNMQTGDVFCGLRCADRKAEGPRRPARLPEWMTERIQSR